MNYSITPFYFKEQEEKQRKIDQYFDGVSFVTKKVESDSIDDSGDENDNLDFVGVSDEVTTFRYSAVIAEI